MTTTGIQKVFSGDDDDDDDDGNHHIYHIITNHHNCFSYFAVHYHYFECFNNFLHIIVCMLFTILYIGNVQ